MGTADLDLENPSKELIPGEVPKTSGSGRIQQSVDSMATSGNDEIQTQQTAQSRQILIFIVYTSMFLDNIMLTIVVPIIPDYLYNLEGMEQKTDPKDVAFLSTVKPPFDTASKDSKRSTGNLDDWLRPDDIFKRMKGGNKDNSTNKSGSLETVIGNSSLTLGILTRREFVGENARVAILLSSKAVVQLVANPVVGVLMSRTGHQIPLFVGSLNLLLSSLLFAFACKYEWLLAARSLQGVASACFGVAGMCLVAERCPEEGGSRGKVMGIVLGATALGVLLGYPLGGLLYDFTGGKVVPFLVVATLVSINTVLQLIYLDLKPIKKEPILSDASKNVPNLLRNWKVLVTTGAIWISTSAMSILEPCLPIWLMDTIKPKRWQIGMVFIPDSLGYLLGTNFLGGFAFRIGRWKIAIAAMLLIGISAIMVASSSSMLQLVGPHFGIGLGIGAVDSALVPLLALLVDCNIQNKNSDSSQHTHESLHAAQYATVYALQQTAVSLAYSLGPILGGELVTLVGFPWLMISVGFFNIIYCPLLLMLRPKKIDQLTENHSTKVEDKETQNILMSQPVLSNYKTNINVERSWVPAKLRFSSYRRFYDSDESD